MIGWVDWPKRAGQENMRVESYLRAMRQKFTISQDVYDTHPSFFHYRLFEK